MTDFFSRKVRINRADCASKMFQEQQQSVTSNDNYYKGQLMCFKTQNTLTLVVYLFVSVKFICI